MRLAFFLAQGALRNGGAPDSKRPGGSLVDCSRAGSAPVDLLSVCYGKAISGGHPFVGGDIRSELPSRQ